VTPDGADSETDAEDELTARWDGDDGDGTGRLTIEARSSGFAGRGRAWFDRESVLEFASQLAMFPIPADGSVSLSGGHGTSSAYIEHLGIGVVPLDVRGQVDVQLHLANEVWPGNPPEGSYETRMHVLTTYPNLGRFAAELRAVVNGTLPTAALLGDRMA
jgi:hypothetical protein